MPMKVIYVTGISNEKEVTDFFMVKSIGLKLGANKKQYLDVTLGDKTGEISGKKWDVSDEELMDLQTINEGDLVKIRAQVTEWNGTKQLRILRIRKNDGEEGLDLREFIKAAPEAPEDMFKYLMDVAEAMTDEDLKQLCVLSLNLGKEKLMYYPAAQRNHHAEMAGLLYHVKRMLMTAEKVCQVYHNLDRDLLYAGVLLHDMEKLHEINSNEWGISDGYSFEGNMLGHIIQGVKVLDQQMQELRFPKEKAIMVEHMILSHHYEPEFGSPRKPLFPEAEMLHYLDMIDARMYDMQEALDATAPGQFSDRVWTLDNRRLYKKEGSDQ
jgi:3'-5' exoribonuclease